MASQINATGKNIMLDALGTACGYLALYTDIGGTTEVAGGSPAYARKAVTYNSAAAGVKTTSADVTFDIPAGVTVRAIGLVTALTGGTQHAVDEPATVETWAAQGLYVVPASTGLTITLT